jgi:hypothetical protein
VLIENSKELHGHLRGVINMLDNVDSDFKAMSSFSEIEADFTASLVVKLQDQISKGKQAIKGEDTIEQIDEWCEKLTSLSITDG